MSENGTVYGNAHRAYEVSLKSERRLCFALGQVEALQRKIDDMRLDAENKEYERSKPYASGHAKHLLVEEQRYQDGIIAGQSLGWTKKVILEIASAKKEVSKLWFWVRGRV